MKYAKRLLKHQLTADEIVEKLLIISEKEQVCLLDSCGVSHLGSHLLIGGIDPLETFEITDKNPAKTLQFLDEKLENDNTFAIFTISYDFGLKLENIKPRKKEFISFNEPDVFVALFDSVLIFDYNSKKSYLIGNKNRFDELEAQLFSTKGEKATQYGNDFGESKIQSNFTKDEYLSTIEKIKEFIRCGDTYQTNLTQQIRAALPENLSPQQIFHNLRKNHPAPFASFIQRNDSTVISASPERFFKVESGEWGVGSKELGVESANLDFANEASSNSRLSTLHSRLISTSPIKGTRPRGETAKEDEKLRKELLNSDKDRAENVMIVDLLRNDLGRICEFGSVSVEKLCDLEQHPTLFHLVSTVNGTLRENIRFSDIIRSVFPCGSITGAPKISTMRIIDELETAPRGLSMGAIGFSSKDLKVDISKKNLFTLHTQLSTLHSLDLSVAIRTMVIKEQQAIFNVGGGIVIDSDPEDEYKETLVKAKALLQAIYSEFIF